MQTSESLLPRLVEIRTDCAEAATMLQARRRNSHVADIERFSLQLTSTFPLMTNSYCLRFSSILTVTFTVIHFVFIVSCQFFICPLSKAGDVSAVKCKSLSIGRILHVLQ